MQYTPYDKYGRYTYTFAKRFTQPLWRYIVLPPREDTLYLKWFTPAESPLEQFFDATTVDTGDVIELFTLDERVVFQGVQIEVLLPAAGITLTPVMNTPTQFESINCGGASKAIYLPQGGTLTEATNLTDTQFIIDNPDYFGFRVDAAGGDWAALQVQVTLMVNEQFDAELPTNADQVRS